MPIRFVTFDALFTLVAPRLPVHVQYAQTFAPHLGYLDPDKLKAAFKTSLRTMQVRKPLYEGGPDAWWSEVIRQTAVGAGADEQSVDKALPKLTASLMARFSSGEGYKLYDDVIPTLRSLHQRGIKTGVITNADSRMRSVLESVSIAPLLNPIIISEEANVQKPMRGIFTIASREAGVPEEQILHVGDEQTSDFLGATNAGMCALLLRRTGSDDVGPLDESESVPSSSVVHTLTDVERYVLKMNRRHPLEDED